MAHHIELTKEELLALDGLILEFQADAQFIPTIVAITAVVGAVGATVGGATAVVQVVGGARASEVDPLESIGRGLLEGKKLSADDLIEIRKAAILKK
jgi:hypothetical protein